MSKIKNYLETRDDNVFVCLEQEFLFMTGLSLNLIVD